MQQTMAAGSLQRVILRSVKGDLVVRGWDQQTIQFKGSAPLGELQNEGDLLVVPDYAGSLELFLPFETAIQCLQVEGDASLQQLRRVQLGVIRGDLALKDINEETIFETVRGDLLAKRLRRGLTFQKAAGDIKLEEIQGEIRFEQASADLALKRVESVFFSSVQGDLEAEAGFHELSGSRVRGDCELEGSGLAARVTIENVSGDVEAKDLNLLNMTTIDGDLDLKATETAEIRISVINGDCHLEGGQVVEIGHIRGDCMLKNAGLVSIGTVSGDFSGLQIADSLQIGNTNGDINVKQVLKSVLFGNINGDLNLEAFLLPDTLSKARVNGDMNLILPPEANLRIKASVLGSLSGRGLASSFAGNQASLVYGEGQAILELSVSGDLNIATSDTPRSSTVENSWNFWGGFSQEMKQFEQEMGQMGQNLSASIASMTSSLVAEMGSGYLKEKMGQFTREAEKQVERAQRFAEEQRRKAEERLRKEDERRASKQEDHKRLHIRFHDREWRIDQLRLQRILDQAQKATSEGVQGAMEAVEQALKNMRLTMPSSPVSEAAKQEMEQPEVAVAPVEEAAVVDIEQEREAILRMIAEGRITPEEGDMLLEALSE